MEALPVRCSRCGCLWVAGLLIPSSFSLEGFDATAETVVGPTKCPLCQAVISDESTMLAGAIFAVLREAKLDRSESDALLNALTQAYESRISHPETIKAIEAAAPRVTGLKRFIPSGDVTGALALIIAILAFANDFVFDWVAPTFKQSEGGTTESSPAFPQRSRWIRFSSRTVFGKRIQGGYYHIDYRYTLRGVWGGTKGYQLVHKMFVTGIYKVLGKDVSSHPGAWQFPIDSSASCGNGDLLYPDRSPYFRPARHGSCTGDSHTTL